MLILQSQSSSFPPEMLRKPEVNLGVVKGVPGVGAQVFGIDGLASAAGGADLVPDGVENLAVHRLQLKKKLSVGPRRHGREDRSRANLFVGESRDLVESDVRSDVRLLGLLLSLFPALEIQPPADIGNQVPSRCGGGL